MSASHYAASATAAPQVRDLDVHDFDWFDAARQRAVPAKFFLPAPDAHAPTPLVLFSHGIGSSRDGYTHLGAHWAAQGIASLHVQHVGSDRTLWRGNPFALLRRFHAAAGEGEAIARVLDLRFALGALLQTEHGAHVDHAHISVAGHSYGANTALLAAGARVVRGDRVLQFRDDRIASAIVISAPPFYGDDDFEPILCGITIPTLHITTARDVIRIPGFVSGVRDRRRVFDAIGGDKMLAVYRCGSHNVFTDERYFDTVATAHAVKSSTRSLTSAFVQQLRGNTRTQLPQWMRASVDLLADCRVQGLSLAG